MPEISLNHEERFILKAQGTIQLGLTWQPCQLFLTSRRLIFKQAARTILECSLDKIISISIVKRSWLMGINVKQIYIEINCASRREYAYIAIAQPNKLVHIMKESMTIMLAERWSYNGGKPESPGDTE